MTAEELYAHYKKCNGFTTDSRSIPEGSMFFALKGDKFDGNDFALDALKAGAKYAVVDRVSLEGESFKGRKCILVENVLSSFQKMASFHRLQFDIPVVGITGTNGKTTTKELVSAVLSTTYNVSTTKGNLNNHIGVPMTLLGINEKTQIAVVEMGASAPGEIALLTSIARPSCGLITNVGKAHLLGFGSFEGVKKTKGELYDFLRQSGGTAFYNADNENLREMIGYRRGLAVRPYGLELQNAKVLPASSEQPFLTMEVPVADAVQTITTHLVGSYNADNVMAALAVAEYFKVPLSSAVRAIENYVPSNNRSQFVRTSRNMLIIDAYNANPTSMNAALNNFASLNFEGKTLILGDMLELGEHSLEEHVKVLENAMNICGDIHLVGREFKSAASKIMADPERVKCFDDSSALRSYFETNPPEGRTILIKGSNGIRLQGINEVL